MTRKTFYRKLRQYAHIFSWTNRHGRIVGYRHGKYFCPLTAICYVEYNKFYNSTYYDEAGAKLGLSEEDYIYIKDRADIPRKSFCSRRALLKCVGLNEN